MLQENEVVPNFPIIPVENDFNVECKFNILNEFGETIHNRC